MVKIKNLLNKIKIIFKDLINNIKLSFKNNKKKSITILSIIVLAILGSITLITYSFYVNKSTNLLIAGVAQINPNDIKINIYREDKDSSGNGLGTYSLSYYIPSETAYTYMEANTTCDTGITITGFTNNVFSISATKRGTCNVYFDAIDGIAEDYIINLFVQEELGGTTYKQMGQLPINETGYYYTVNNEKTSCNPSGTVSIENNKILVYASENTTCNVYADKNEKLTLYKTIQAKYNEGNTFVKLYDGEGSDTYANPVYYYNGAVEDNNVLFGGFCWKIVRTTDTGGVKLIYNGVQKTDIDTIPLEESQYLNLSNDANYPYTFDSTNKTWTSTNKTNGATGTITFTVAEAGDYILTYTVSSEANFDKAIFYKDGTELGTYSGSVSGTITLEGLTTSNVIKVEYTKDSSGASGNDNVVFSLGKTIGNSYLTCNNTGTDSQIGTSAFNSSSKSPAYVGYMYNTVYTFSSKSMSSLSNIVFGNSFTYSGGTYTLTDTMTIATWSEGYNTINNNHYTCFTTGTTCPSLYYVYYTSSSYAYYITLTGGKSVSDALNEMLYADDVNKTDSAMKTYIETWYENNMTAYTSYLEDTTYCNDRSILNLNGWNPNGGDTSGSLQFKNYTTNYSLVCGSVTDQFRVGNTKAPLKYPVGLLTSPEVWLAYKDASYSTYYLNTGQHFRLGSPCEFSSNVAYEGYISSAGDLGQWPVNTSLGAKPSVSLKPGTGYISGNGSYTSPYLIE
ncbi:MAG: hypothetical protein PUD07_05550 [bacterium]|nr:hypothetical protein [bacterium]